MNLSSLSELVTGSSYEDVVVEDNLSAIAFEADISVRDSITNVSAPGAADGRIAVEVDYYFTNPYSFLWSTGDTTQVIDGLSVGEYTLTVTNAQGCRKVLMYEVETTTSIVDNSRLSAIQLVPNPSRSYQPARLVINKAVSVQSVTIYDIQGQEVNNNSKTEHQMLVLPRLSAGLYFVEIRLVNGQRSVLRWVVV